MKNKGLKITVVVLASVLAVVLIGFAVIFLSGNRFTVARCIVTENGSLYMVYDDNPVKLNYNGNTDYTTGDKLLIVHQSVFAESYPEQTRARFIMKLGSGSEEDIPQKAFDVLIETGNYSVSNVGGVDGPASITTTIDVDALKAKYPAYFELPTDKGLEVYVWQMAGNSYSCGLLSGKNLGYTQEELWDLHKSPATLEEMRTIVAYYISNEGVAKDQVVICPIAMPHSSYAYNIDDAYRQELEEKFWKDLPIVETTEWGSPIIDVAAFDIDADGKVERCVLAYGPTSGLFTVQLTVTENGVDEYSDIYYLSAGEFSFVETDEGMKLRRMPAKEDEEPTDYSFSLKDGNIVLTADGEDISSWEQ